MKEQMCQNSCNFHLINLEQVEGAPWSNPIMLTSYMLAMTLTPRKKHSSRYKWSKVTQNNQVTTFTKAPYPRYHINLYPSITLLGSGQISFQICGHIFAIGLKLVHES